MAFAVVVACRETTLLRRRMSSAANIITASHNVCAPTLSLSMLTAVPTAWSLLAVRSSCISSSAAAMSSRPARQSPGREVANA